MPRASCARNGKVTLVNSPSGTSTVDPSGTAAATIATWGDTWLPIATVSGGTPTSRAYAPRAAATSPS